MMKARFADHAEDASSLLTEKNSSTRPRMHLGARLSSRLAQPLVALLVTASLAACGVIKMGYNNADTVVPLWLNRYLDLDSAQKGLVRQRLKSLLAWHRSTQLPDYARLAADLQKRAADPITTADFALLDKEMLRRAETMVEHAIPDAADLLLTVKPEQVKTLQKKFADNDEKFRDDNLRGDVERRQKVRYEKALDRAEEWYGRFDRQQRAAIRRASDARPLNNEFVLAERQRREDELVALVGRVVRDKPPRETVIGLLHTYYERLELSPDRERRAFQEALHHATDEMNSAIANLATREQRDHAVEKLQQWIDDFKKMAVTGA